MQSNDVTSLSWALVVSCVLLVGCSSKSKPGGNDAAPLIAPCPTDFGQPVEPDPALSGQEIVVQGWLDRVGNPARPAGRSCPDGAGALVLYWIAPDTQPWVRLIKSDGSQIMCGCPEYSDEECLTLSPGMHVKLRGELQYLTLADATCFQPPCYVMHPQQVCLLLDCQTDEDCPGSSCNIELAQCRATPGQMCHLSVGCHAEGGVPHFCSIAGGGFEATCQPQGDGSEDSACGVDEHCTCSDCICAYQSCISIPP